MKAVSADIGPITSKPSLFKSVIAGFMDSISSFPYEPSSPACGFKPKIAILGLFNSYISFGASRRHKTYGAIASKR